MSLIVTQPKLYCDLIKALQCPVLISKHVVLKISHSLERFPIGIRKTISRARNVTLVRKREEKFRNGAFSNCLEFQQRGYIQYLRRVFKVVSNRSRIMERSSCQYRPKCKMLDWFILLTRYLSACMTISCIGCGSRANTK